MPARRPQLAELGVFLLVVALPLVFTPFSASPFGDPKVVVLAAGTLALWASGLPIDRRLGLAAAAWVGATIAAALVGVDLGVGLTARTGGEGGGAILIACVGVLAVLGAGLSSDLCEQARRWVVASGAIVASIGLAVRVFPDLLTVLPSDVGLIGATLGNQLFATAFVAAALAAAIGGSILRPAVGKAEQPERVRAALSPIAVGLVAFLAIGAGTFGERSSIVLPVVATAAVLWRVKLGARTTFVMATAVIVPMLVWQLLAASVFADSTRGQAVTGISAQTTDLQRLTVWRAMIRAAIDRPVLGWGPGSSRSAYLATATGADIDEAGRAWSDAHDLFMETGVSSGVLGLAALLWLVVLLVSRSFRSGRDRAWAFGAAVCLTAYSLVEPFGLVLTPLLFLFAGVSAGRTPSPIAEGDAPVPAGRAVSLAVTVALSIAALVSVQMLAAASLERWGRLYGETWALEGALRTQPWRLTSTERLALIWALDGRGGDEAASQRARDLIAEAVEDHPWDGHVRLTAADIEILLGDEAAARAWIDEHLERFPGDREGVGNALERADQNTVPGA